jgi:hypothetical protein
MHICITAWVAREQVAQCRTSAQEVNKCVGKRRQAMAVNGKCAHNFCARAGSCMQAQMQGGSLALFMCLRREGEAMQSVYLTATKVRRDQLMIAYLPFSQ